MRDAGMTDVKNADISEPIAKEIVRLSELYIDASLRVSLAAETRAMQLSGFLSAASTALIVASIGFLFSNQIDRGRFSVGVALFIAALLFAIALIYSLSSAHQRGINVGGNYLSRWSSEQDLHGPLAKSLIDQARIYEEQIFETMTVLRSRDSEIRTAIKLMAFTPLLSFVSGVTAYLGFAPCLRLIDTLEWLLLI
jgi:hypothetical protein